MNCNLQWPYIVTKSLKTYVVIVGLLNNFGLTTHVGGLSD